MALKNKKDYSIPLINLVVIVVSIFIVELTIMFLLSFLEVTPLTESLLDSILLIIVSSPFLYFFLYRPLIIHINERKKAEEELRFYSEISMNMSDGINLVRASDGLLVYTNQNFNEMFGYVDGELIGKQVLVLNANQDKLSSDKFVNNVLECLDKEGKWRGEVQNKKKDNSLFWTQASVVKFRHFEFGDCYLSIQYEITKDKQAKEELKRAKKDAEIANNAKSEFLASMSHEIRTPMTAMLGMVEFLSDSPLNDDQQKALRILRGSSDNLLVLIDDILDLSKIEAGRLELEEKEFDLDVLITEIGSFMGVSARAKGIELLCNIEPDVPLNVIGDLKRLRQIICNLLGNAIKFTEKGRVDVDVRKRETRGGITELEFYVKDTGIGIPEDKIDIIFERFTQADSSTSRNFGGTGLGIAISKLLVEAMAGRIWVESELEKGSTFYFTVKLRTAEASKGEKAIKRDVEKKNILWKRSLSILVAEDSEDNINLIHMHLKETPHVVDIVKNGKVAVEKFQTGNYDLVLMDMEMPVMDGYKATEEIRKWEAEKKKKPTPIVALTAHALKEHEQKSMDAGCTGHFTKPFKKQKLLEAIYEYTN